MKMSIPERKFFGKYIKIVFYNTLKVNELNMTVCQRKTESQHVDV